MRALSGLISNLSKDRKSRTIGHHFTALTFPENHPCSRNAGQFFIEKMFLISPLRTHTSSVRYDGDGNQKLHPGALSPWSRFIENEAISAGSTLYLPFQGRSGLLTSMKCRIRLIWKHDYHFAQGGCLQGEKLRIPTFLLLRFTEPRCKRSTSLVCLRVGKSCQCLQGTWSEVEIGGSGMVDPNVLWNCGSRLLKNYTGFAFGMGMSVLRCLKYRIKRFEIIHWEGDFQGYLKQCSDLIYSLINSSKRETIENCLPFYYQSINLFFHSSQWHWNSWFQIPYNSFMPFRENLVCAL